MLLLHSGHSGPLENFAFPWEKVFGRPWASADFFPGGGEGARTYFLSNYKTIFFSKKTKTYYFWLARGGKSSPCPPPDANADDKASHRLSLLRFGSLELIFKELVSQKHLFSNLI
jgi:hypothetical protein